MKRIWDKLWDWLPILWGIVLTLIITFGGLALLIAIIKWFLRVVGVM